MALGLPQSGTRQTGSQAIAQNAISSMTTADLELADKLTFVQIIENLFNLGATKLVEKNTRESAANQALGTLLRGIGVGLVGAFTLGSSFASTLSESFASKDFAGDQAEIDTMKEYRDHAKARATTTNAEASSLDDKKSLDKMQKKRMERLSNQQDFKEENLETKRTLDDEEMSDQGLIELSKEADSEQAENLAEHLDDLISKKEASLTSKREMASRKGQRVASVLQGIGGIGDGVLQSLSAESTQKAGEKDAAKAAAMSAQGMASANENQLGSQVSEAIRAAIQAPETNVSIAQGDNLSGG